MMVYIVTDQKNLTYQNLSNLEIISKSFNARAIKSKLIGDVDLYNGHECIHKSDLIIFGNANFYFLQRLQFEILMDKIPAFKIYIGFDDEYMINTSLYFARFMDLMITFDLVAYEYYRSLGIRALCCPHPVNVQSVRQNNKFNFDVAFIGRVDDTKPERIRILKRLAEEFPNSYFPGVWGDRVSDYDMANIFFNSKINLNFTGITQSDSNIDLLYNSQRRGFKGRPFEIGAAGGFCLSEFSPSLEFFLKRGVDIDYFHSNEDLIRKIKFYLTSDLKRGAMRDSLNSKILKMYSSDSVDNCFVSLILEAKESKNLEVYDAKVINHAVMQVNLFIDDGLEMQRLLHNMNSLKIGGVLIILIDVARVSFSKITVMAFNLLKLVSLKILRLVWSR